MCILNKNRAYNGCDFYLIGLLGKIITLFVSKSKRFLDIFFLATIFYKR